jgi:hypothetical protein
VSEIEFVVGELSVGERFVLEEHAQTSNAPVFIVPSADSVTCPNPWLHWDNRLAVLIADPQDWSAVAFRSGRRPLGRPTWELVVEAAMRRETEVVGHATSNSSQAMPSLRPAEKDCPAWKRSGIEAFVGERQQALELDDAHAIAIRAGIMQFGDHLTESHQLAQKVEGRSHQGDYWHAIHHRREGDYGNSKYWYRQVGPDMSFQPLAEFIPELAEEFSPRAGEMVMSLLHAGEFDPFRFVDLARRAVEGKDREVVKVAERVQWLEMLALMRSSFPRYIY